MATAESLPPSVVPEPDWVPVDPFPEIERVRSFVSGEPSGDRLHLAYYRRGSDGRLVGTAWFGPGCEGPPGFAHGGSVAAVLDEAMGAAAWIERHAALVVRLVVDLRRMLPLETDTVFEAWITDVAGRKVTVRATLVDARGNLVAESEGLFIILSPEQMDGIMAEVDRRREAAGRESENAP
jgi:acyl-coenzyme A thioesterase PaaI-like protein